ncbi:hypothetical protein [Maliponia aquimaris]|uniref:Uncharacterized protein n=1 Tax=Maliponia aquimaris TaxID=1673631 RepID=A0A238JYM2_9RHOB|nr:hypothetical protein [Maliponia aquimaris]SMX35755.1 hypothetical protein MAA8898_00633 [Maliponia aquimaris]
MFMTSYRRRARAELTALAVMCVVCLAAPRGVQAQSCQVPADLMSLARTLAALPSEGADVPAVMTDRLAAQMAGLSEARVVRTLHDNGLDSVSTIAVDLMAEAERIGSGGSYNPARIRAMLSEFDQQSTLACVETGSAIFQQIQQGRTGGFLSGSGFNWSEVERRAEEDKLFAAGAVVAVMTVFIAVLMLIDTGYRWAMALLYNRKACRIPACLHVGSRRIDGLVLTLGKGGCRFHPLNVVAFDEALSDLRGGEARIEVEDTALSVRCSGIYDTVTDFRFDRPLTLKQQRALLEHSTISPYYIRKSRDGGTAVTDSIVGQEQ